MSYPKYFVCDHLYNCLYSLNRLEIKEEIKEKYKKYIYNLRSTAIKDIYNLIRKCITDQEKINIFHNEISYLNDDRGTLKREAMQQLRE